MHHAGLMPILREMTELLFARGFIKVLFCTETMSVGINLPVKTTIFTDITKFNGDVMRTLYSHEYTQAAGRAGRLGLDTVGHVIHLNNLFRNVETVNYKAMMNGKPQTLTSKFKISYNLLLNLLDIGDNNLVQFANRSMVTGDLDNQMNQLNVKLNGLNTELQNLKTCIDNIRTPVDTIKQCIALERNLEFSANKKRKEIERQLVNIRDNYKYYEQDKATYNKFINKEKEIVDTESQISNLKSYIQSEVHIVLDLLGEDKLIEDPADEGEDKIRLSLKGKIASQLRETHCLVFAKLLENKALEKLSSKQLVSLFSCFTNVSVKEDYKDYSPYTDDDELKQILKDISNSYLEYQQKEIDYRINSGIDYNIHYDLLSYLDEWCDSENVEDCKIVLQRLGFEKELFLGEFVKALLKINNISSELEKIAEMTGNIAFLSKLKEIPSMTLKYVVTNQSLYV